MSTPTLEQYPGYFPKGSKPFWTRVKVGFAAGIAGLLVGITGSGSEAEAPAARDDSKDIAVQSDLAEALEDKAAALQETSELEDQLQAKQAQAAKAVRQLEKQAKVAQRKAVQTAVQAAVAKVRREEQRKAATAIQAAKTAAAAATAATPVAPLAPSAPATDPQFSYCYEANDAGYGPYYSGQDPEYAWYDDADDDGIVCES